MKKFLCILISIVTIIVSAFALCACGQGDRYQYAVIDESGVYIIHELTDCVLIGTEVILTTKCCGMNIRTNSINVVLYEQYPENLFSLYTNICDKLTIEGE